MIAPEGNSMTSSNLAEAGMDSVYAAPMHGAGSS